MAKGKIAQQLLDEIDNLTKAKEKGFDTQPWFHGGSSSHIQEIDYKKLGQNTGTPASREALFLTRSKEDAQKYADMSKGVVHEFYLRPENGVTVDWAQVGLPIRSNNGQRVLAGILQDLKDQGHGYARLKNTGDTADGAESAADTLAVLNPSLLRYKNAKFEDLKSKNTLAAAAPIAVGIGASALTPDQAQAAVQQSISPTNSSTSGLLDRAKKQYDSGVTGSAKAPVNQKAKYAADWANKYNQWRKSAIANSPIDYILPVGELPQELLDKIAYGERVTMSDRIKATFGLL